MEGVLEAYKLPYNEKRPAVCLDETDRQPAGGTREGRPAQPGQPGRYDYEPARNGVGNLFMMSGPPARRREATVTQRRTREGLRDMAENRYPDAEKIIAVMDSLNTRPPASRYAAFEPKEARRLWERFEIHYTPKHGSAQYGGTGNKRREPAVPGTKGSGR
jgi:hypothetical protein